VDQVQERWTQAHRTDAVGPGAFCGGTAESGAAWSGGRGVWGRPWETVTCQRGRDLWWACDARSLSLTGSWGRRWLLGWTRTNWKTCWVTSFKSHSAAAAGRRSPVEIYRGVSWRFYCLALACAIFW